jgi:hypothetical protein
VQVIIASPPSDGGFIGAALLGGQKRDTATSRNAEMSTEANAAPEEK